jgi:hypothetical protein
MVWWSSEAKMALLIEQSATMMCPHAGQVQPSPSITRVTIGGLAPLAKDDKCLIAACPFVLANAPHPCNEIQWLTATVRITAQGKALLIDSSSGLCKAADGAPQGSPNVVLTQQRVRAT